jgi:hypothetical protein
MSDLHDAALTAAAIVFDDVALEDEHVAQVTPTDGEFSVGPLVLISMCHKPIAQFDAGLAVPAIPIRGGGL